MSRNAKAISFTPEVLRLRCVRCGDWHERELGDPYLPELCSRCFDRYLECGTRTLGRFVDRYRRGTEKHPTMLALKEAWARYTDTASTGDGEPPW